MKNLIYFAKSWTTKVFDLCNVIILDLRKDFRPSDKFGNPYLTIPRVTSNNSEHLCALVSGTCFRVLGTLLYLHEYCPYITYYCFFCQSFIIILQKLIYKKEILKLSILPFNAPIDYVFCLDLKIYDHKVIF